MRVAVSVAAVLVLASASSAFAPNRKGARCAFSAQTRKLEVVVELDPHAPGDERSGEARVNIVDGEFQVFGGRRNERVPCAGDVPTTTNVDSINVRALHQAQPPIVFFDAVTPALAPGATDEGDGSSETEITADFSSDGIVVVGLAAGADRVTLGGVGGHAGANLNAAEAAPDVDVVAQGAALFVQGGRGPDHMSAAAVQPGFDGPVPFGPFSPSLLGEEGDDTLIGSRLLDTLAGGAGADRLRALGGNDHLFAIDGARDLIRCGRGHRDFVEPDRVDRLHGCELRDRVPLRAQDLRR